MPVTSDSATKVELDPRVERSREVVLKATLDLLAEVGYGELTIEGVASRSGVAKSTIYRHWKGKLALITDAFTELRQLPDDLPATGPVRDRMAILLAALAVRVSEPDWRVRCLPALIDASARSPEVAEVCRELAESGLQQFVDVLDDGVAAGELPPDTDTVLLADALTAPILMRGLFHRPTPAPDEIPDILAQLLP
jgi:AcrR family transcriptional regulator